MLGKTRTNKLTIFWAALLALCVVLVLTGCATGTPTQTTIDETPPAFMFSVIESPITGNCYEIATRNPTTHKGYMGMAQIDCPKD